jgi:NAD(P)-dependent dehydrogenase (short-subunit alcohol dehydrogenase family)
MLLNNKVIIVTGVGPGMGMKLCRIAAREGAAVAVSARSAGYIREITEEIANQGGRAIAVPTDVGDEAQCKRLAAATAEAFGRIDGLVNSARARSAPRTLEDAKLEEWGPIMDVTCFGALRMAQAVLPWMKHQTDGAIVNIGTISTVRPWIGEADYAVAKTAMGGLSRQMAAEFGKYNIRVNHVRMGWMWGVSIQRFMRKQAQTQSRSEESLIADVASRIPLGVIPPDDECAKSALFFLSDYAKMVTGATLDVNGGEYMAP